MQIVSDLQQRPNKGRLRLEKALVPLYDMCTLVQVICFIIHSTTASIAASRTFSRSIWAVNNEVDVTLSDAIVFRTRDCVVNTTLPALYAFQNVSLTLRAANTLEIYADHVQGIRLSVAIGAVCLVLGITNRSAVEFNFFHFKFRSLYLYKDLLSALELVFVAYLLQIAISTDVPGSLLRDYLTRCGIRSTKYLPFVSVTTLYVIVGASLLTYVVGSVIYLWNSLPKYGIMNAEEIAAYKLWWHAKAVERLEMEAALEDAKRVNARLQMLRHMQYMEQNDISAIRRRHAAAPPSGAGHPSQHPAASAAVPPLTLPPLPPM